MITQNPDLENNARTSMTSRERLEQSAAGWRSWGWFFTASCGVVIMLLLISVATYPSFGAKTLPIYWFLLIWWELSGIVFLFISKSMKGLLEDAPSNSAVAVRLINRVKFAIRLFVVLNWGMVGGCLLFYPPAVPFIIGQVLISPRVLSRDRETLNLLEDDLAKADRTLPKDRSEGRLNREKI